MDMARWFPFIALALLTMVLSSLRAHAQYDDERYNIVRPEPSSATTYKSRRGTRTHVAVPRSKYEAQPYNSVPPSIIAPRTGVALPNLPMPGSGPGGRETSQDRAVRCSHQAGVYGQAAGDRNAYIGGCINQ